MPRLRIVVIYAAVFGTALLVSTLIASLFTSRSVSIANVAPPTVAPSQQPAPTATTLVQLVVSAPTPATPSLAPPTAPPPTSTAPPSIASATSTATATPLPTPTARQVATPQPLVFAAQVVEQPKRRGCGLWDRLRFSRSGASSKIAVAEVSWAQAWRSVRLTASTTTAVQPMTKAASRSQGSAARPGRSSWLMCRTHLVASRRRRCR